MKSLIPYQILENSKVIALVAIVISIITWWMDISGLVYECPYCRTQRTVIGVLGMMLLLPFIHYWLLKLVAIEIAGFGFVVAAFQHFRGWSKIWSNEFQFNATLWTDPTILSAIAMFMIMFLALVILSQQK
ncbi:hypothetical protein DRW07_09035 [Alteromonas sediminis]|uniref:Disulfide bond formation protein B n=1 Tax=Alteromonas sediminis TaxID=2259342 RepID=A0A3N5Y3D0_9ALTE|nr:hypothetical protein [Alteromonas sediminis]RPJ67643.1 hypothetical protein DRW07_09035 [Alteromonas sediminis]